jgi:PhnB protein
MSVKPQPDGYHSVTPYLICKNAAAAIEFYRQAFGATPSMAMNAPDGRIMHAEIKIGDSVVMLADEHPEIHALSPDTVGGTPVSLLVYVPDVDAVFAKAVECGATAERAVATQFYGDRTGGIRDPFGHRWYLATHVKDVSREEMEDRTQAAH